jgi:hypothetical protein
MLKTAAVVATLVVTTGSMPSTQEQRSRNSASAILQSQEPITVADVPVIRRDVAAALADRYLTSTLDRGPKMEQYVGGVEYLMNAAGRIRFKRLRLRDQVTGTPNVTLIEVTDVPAVLCRDRSTRRGKLELTYTEDRGKWLPVRGSIHLGANSLDQLMDLPANGFTDAGHLTVDGKRTRGVRFQLSPQATATFWLDVTTLLPLRHDLSMAFEGKSIEVGERYDYPKPVPMERPAGVQVPDCV